MTVAWAIHIAALLSVAALTAGAAIERARLPDVARADPPAQESWHWKTDYLNPLPLHMQTADAIINDRFGDWPTIVADDPPTIVADDPPAIVANTPPTPPRLRARALEAEGDADDPPRKMRKKPKSKKKNLKSKGNKISETCSAGATRLEPQATSKPRTTKTMMGLAKSEEFHLEMIRNEGNDRSVVGADRRRELLAAR